MANGMLLSEDQKTQIRSAIIERLLASKCYIWEDINTLFEDSDAILAYTIYGVKPAKVVE